jgi:hypothetical protein
MKHKLPPTAFLSLVLILGVSGQALANAGACPGTWRTLTPAPSGAIAAVEELPDGRVVVATATGGLRLYGPNAQGTYQWSAIVATLGGLVSNRLNDLAIFKNELWVATDDRGISIQDLATGAWRTVNAAGSALPDDTVNRLTVVQAVRGSSNPSIAESSVWASTPSGAAHYHRVQIGGQASVWIWSVIDESDGLPDQDVLDVAVHDNRDPDRRRWAEQPLVQRHPRGPRAGRWHVDPGGRLPGKAGPLRHAQLDPLSRAVRLGHERR